MQIPRRKCLALVSSGVTVGFAGCSSLGESNTETASQKTEFTATISGPDGEEPFFTREDIAEVGDVEDSVQGGYVVPVELTESGTDQAVEAFNEVGAADAPDDSSISYTIRGEVDVEQTLGISRSLASRIGSDDWNGEFQLQLEDEDTATAVRDALRQD
jgi:hypothetical protein